MSVKNGEKFIRDSIDSILKQSFTNFEFVIVDNHSNDKSRSIINNYIEKDKRVKLLINNNNEKPSEGRVRAIKEVKNDWFALMDADDISHPYRLEKQIEFINNLNNINLGVLSTYGKYIDQKNKVIGNMYVGPKNFEEFHNKFKNNNSYSIIDPSSVINKKAYIESGGYINENFAYDIDLFYKISEKGYIIQTVNEPLYYYRIHANSYSVKSTMEQRKITHYVNFNMRKRRNNENEISKDVFFNDHWKGYYKFFRTLNDLSMLFYKHAGYSFLQKKYLKFCFYLFFSFMISPKYVFKKLYITFLKKK